MIDPATAKHADEFECYCGRALVVAPGIVCSGCQKQPERCTCVELEGNGDDGEAKHDP